MAESQNDESPLASFRLYDIQQVFSNGDGTVSSIERITPSCDPQFISGHAGNSVVLSVLPLDTTNGPSSLNAEKTTIPESTAAALGLIALGVIVLLRKRN